MAELDLDLEDIKERRRKGYRANREFDMDALIAEVERLREEATDWGGIAEVARVAREAAEFEETYCFVIEEEPHRCPDGGEHCECVAFLQLEMGKLKAELAELKGRRCQTCAHSCDNTGICSKMHWANRIPTPVGVGRSRAPKTWACGDWESKERPETPPPPKEGDKGT